MITIRQFSLALCSLLLLSLFAPYAGMSQSSQKYYDAGWKRVDSFNRKQLPKEALTIVNQLYQRAMTEKNQQQQIKALINRINLTEVTTDEETPVGITMLEKEILTTQEPGKSILQNMLASAYWNVFKQDRWKYYDRTQLAVQNNNDINTWTAVDMHKKIASLFAASLKDKPQLKALQIAGYEPILVKGNARQLRPTLFDLLAFKALEYYEDEERTITKAADAFKIITNNAFDPADSFIRQKFTTTDTASLEHKALLLYQEILGFHINDEKPDALIDADLRRLDFVRNRATQAGKEAAWVMAVKHIAHQYNQTPAAAQAWYLYAADLANLANNYDPITDTTNRYAYKEALTICKQIISQPAQSEGKTNCRQLENEILRRTLELNTEKVNLPQQPFRSLISYRNISQINIRIIQLNDKFQNSLEGLEEEVYWNKLTDLPVYASQVQALPATDDYQQHRTEIKINPLPVGAYAILVADNNNFNSRKNVLAVQFIHVSNIAYIHKKDELYVLHRETGKPLANTTVKVSRRDYNYETRKYSSNEIKTLKTNNNGFVKLDTDKKNQNNIQLAFYNGKDALELSEQLYLGYWNPDENADTKVRTETFLFTDRSIYRPGQTLQVKGLVVASDLKDKSVQQNVSTTLYLLDPNHQKIDSVKVTTNKFGSYTAAFRLPENKLGGSFLLADEKNNGRLYIRVEEYKRPSFAVELMQPEGMIRLNDNISIKGSAIAFSGNNINDATVSYRVVRKPRWIFFRGYGKSIWPPYPGRQQEIEIANGTVQTNAKGEFEIPFKALAETENRADKNQSYFFEVTADVTDINGETRSANLSTPISRQAVLLTIDMPDQMPADSLKTLIITAENAGGIRQNLNSTVQITRLIPPANTFRDRLWSQPDMFTMNKSEYSKNFPADIYSDEDQVEKWELDRTPVYAVGDSIRKDGKWSHEIRPLEPGWYVIKVKGDSDGKYGAPEAIKYIHFTGKENTAAFYDLFVSGNTSPLKPGDKLSVGWNSNMKDLTVIREVIRNNQSVTTDFTGSGDKSKTFSSTIAETDRGGMYIIFSTIKNNRFYNKTFIADIPFGNKDLIVETKSFRDKTLPGSKETWTLSIKAKEGTLKAAEVLASMYDASLDELNPHSWNKPFFSPLFLPYNWQAHTNICAINSRMRRPDEENIVAYHKYYDQLIGVLQNYYTRRMIMTGAVAEIKGEASKKKAVAKDGYADMAAAKQESMNEVPPPAAPAGGNAEQPTASTVQVRKNLQETAFFFPQLIADENGAVSFTFTMPEALTRWKWMSFAHTSELATGYLEKNTVTQKDLMVQPNLPRFLREGDRIDLSTKIANLTDKEMTGQVELQLLDADTRTPVDGWFQNVMPNQYFTAKAGLSTVSDFSIQIPYQYNKPLIVRIIARSGEVSDGEEIMLPVLANRMLVTETKPIYLRGNENKNISWDKLKTSGSSETLQQQSLTIEFTANPTWFVVQALPYLAERKNASVEQQFSRFYANIMAAGILAKAPRMREIINQWTKNDTSALLSQLEKNQELKSVLLEETPWVLESKNETEQRRRLAMLIDMKTMQRELAASFQSLRDMQSSNGGFFWFPGCPEDRYMTQYVINGIGQLKKAGMIPADLAAQTKEMTDRALQYLDQRLTDDYQTLIRNKRDLTHNQIGPLVIHQLYLRSFFPETVITKEHQTAYQFYRKQAASFWTKQSRYEQAMIALVLLRNNEPARGAQVLKSLAQFAVRDTEAGMYWKENIYGYYWYQSPIETQSLLIEAFAEAGNYAKEVGDMKTWLIRQKQTTNWKSSKATANACYALLQQGADWTKAEPTVTILLGNKAVQQDQREAGTGYFKTVIPAESVKPEMGDIKVSIKGNGTAAAAQPAWGAIYWQYFEQLNKITEANNGKDLSLKRQYYTEKNSSTGPVLEEINNLTPLKPGDKLVVRMIISTNRNLEYVHLKDQRAAGLEPQQALSGYQWKTGMWYYQSPKDASMQFFFGALPKGTHVLEYRLFITNTGVFSTGISTLQCLYAPEFSAHSEGVNLRVEKQ